MLKPIPNFPEYFCTKTEDIFSSQIIGNYGSKPKRPRQMRKWFNKHTKRWFISIKQNDEIINRPVAWCVLESFVGPRPKGMWACHGKHGSTDDSLKNLSWSTPSQNCMDKLRDNTHNRGERHPTHILNEMQVRIIIRCLADHTKLVTVRSNGCPITVKLFSQRYLAKVFQACQQTISTIKTGRNWYWLTKAKR